MSEGELTFTGIRSLSDRLLVPWLELYELAFPERLREPVSAELRFLIAIESGRAPNAHMLAAVSQDDLVGLAQSAIVPDTTIGYLMYLAVHVQHRSHGLGTRLYREVERRLREAGATSIVIEVEVPQHSASPYLASRRICFYERLGARLLLGIDYSYTTRPDAEPVASHIMVHPLGGLPPASEGLDIARRALGESVVPVGMVRWATP